MAEGRAVAGIVAVMVAGLALALAVRLGQDSTEDGEAKRSTDRTTTTSPSGSGSGDIFGPGARIEPTEAGDEPWVMPEGAESSGVDDIGDDRWTDFDAGTDHPEDGAGFEPHPPAADLYLVDGQLKAGEDTILTFADELATGRAGCDVTRLRPSIPVAELTPGTFLCLQTNGAESVTMKIFRQATPDSVRFGYHAFDNTPGD